MVGFHCTCTVSVAAVATCMHERPNERVITVGIGWVLLASATSGFSGYIKLAYCSSAKGAPVAQHLTSIQKVLGSIPSWVLRDFFTLSESLSSLEEFTMSPSSILTLYCS